MPHLQISSVASAGVPAKEDLCSNGPGVGWETAGGPAVKGALSAGRPVCVGVPGAAECRMPPASRQQGGLQPGPGRSFHGDVPQCAEEGDQHIA